MRFITSAAVLCGLSFVLPVASSKAQRLPVTQTRTISFSTEDIASWEKSIESLHKKTGLIIVAEDAPLENKAEAGAEDRPIQDVSVGEALRQVADKYDYSVETSGNLVLLKKRFSNPADFPCVTPQECLNSLQNIRAILQPFDPKVPARRTLSENDPLIANFAASLSAEQARALEGDGLAMQALISSQRTQAERFSLYIYTQSNTGNLLGVAEELKNADRLSLGYGDFDRENQFGYSVPRQTGKSIFQSFKRHSSMSGAAWLAPTLPDQLPRLGPLNKDSTLYFSLKSVVEHLNSAAPQPSKRYAVAEELAPKRVTIAGITKASPDRLMSALARVYGLRVVEASEPGAGVAQLTFQRTRKAANVNEIGDALRHAIPEPLMRSLLAGSPPPEDELPPEKRNSFEAYLRHKAQKDAAFQRQQRPTFLRQAAGKMLEQTFLARHSSSSNKRSEKLPVPALEEREKNVFAVALMVPALDTMQSTFLKPVPEYLTRFDDVVMKGGAYVGEDGKNRFRLHFYLPNREGKLSLRMGVNGMTYTPKQ